MRQLGHIVPAAVIELLAATPLSEGKVAFAWRNAVGAALDRSTRVHLEGRVLIVEAADAQWTREIERSRDIILGRVRALLGQHTVGRLEVRTK